MLTKIKKLIKNNSDFFRFIVVGASNTLITYIVYNIVYSFGASPTLSNIIGYVAGIVNGYYWSSKWVFKKDRSHRSAIKFLILGIFCLALSSVLVFLLTHELHVHARVAPIISIPITMIINFWVNKVWTFKGENPRTKQNLTEDDTDKITGPEDK